jgi:hypothetical protein
LPIQAISRSEKTLRARNEPSIPLFLFFVRMEKSQKSTVFMKRRLSEEFIEVADEGIEFGQILDLGA